MNKSITNVETDCLKIIDDLLNITHVNERTIDVSLVGGALRDLILDNDSISDIDLLVCLNNKMNSFTDYSGDSYYSCEVQISKYRNYEKNEVSKIANELKNLGYETKSYLFFDDEMDGEDYKVHEKQAIYETDNELYGVLKVSHPKLKYNIDLLFVLSGANYVQKMFDFNICKIESSLVLGSNKIQYKEGRWINNNIVQYYSFLQDIKNKEFKYLEYDASLESIKKSFEVHYPKMQKKYPDFKLKIEFSHEASKEKEYCDILNQDVLKKRSETQNFILKQAQMAQIKFQMGNDNQIKSFGKRRNKI